MNLSNFPNLGNFPTSSKTDNEIVMHSVFPLATLFIYVVIVRPPGLPCPVMRAHEIGILSKILSATGGKWIILQKDVPVSNLVSLT